MTFTIRLKLAITAIACGIALAPGLSQAACSPETVQFYLDKGFTQEQITQLCSFQSEDKPSYQPYQKPMVIYQEGVRPGYSKEESEAQKALEGSLNARAINITKDRINYIQPICLVAGNTPDFDERARHCVEVAFSLGRKGLTVRESGRSLILFGEPEVVVIGDIKRKFVADDPFAAFSPDVRRQFMGKYEARESGNQTHMTLRKGASIDRVVQALRTLELTAEGSRPDQDIVEQIFEGTYEPPKEEPRPAEPLEQEKKKRWWNPFD